MSINQKNVNNDFTKQYCVIGSTCSIPFRGCCVYIREFKLTQNGEVSFSFYSFFVTIFFIISNLFTLFIFFVLFSCFFFVFISSHLQIEGIFFCIFFMNFIIVSLFSCRRVLWIISCYTDYKYANCSDENLTNITTKE